MGRKEKELLPVKKKPRGRPFEKGNTVSRDSAIKRAKKRLVSVKLIEFKNAIELIANEGMSVKDACEKANILERVFYDIKNATPETKRVYYEALKRRTDRDIERIRNEVMVCDKDTAFSAKIKTEFIKWISGKLNPERYGEVDNRPPVNLEIKIGGETVTVAGSNKK